MFVDVAVTLMNPHLKKRGVAPLDTMLIQRCCMLHDHGEGLTGRDVLDHKKSDKTDLEEYLSFMDHIKDLPLIIQQQYEHAFLVQFALSNSPIFPEKAREVMRNILYYNYFEALTFKACERFEYIFYAVEMETALPDILTQVIQAQLPHYQIYAQKLPGFREILFTEDVEKWMQECMEKYSLASFVVL